MPFASTNLHSKINGWYQLDSPPSAPEFNLLEVGKLRQVHLKDIEADKLVLSFLPGVWAPWSRKYLADLQKHMPKIQESGAELLTVISQDVERLTQYARETQLKIPVLADPHGAIATRYGIFDDITTEPMKLSRPVLFVLNKDKMVHFKFLGRHLTDKPKFKDLSDLLNIDINPKPSRFRPLFALRKLLYAGH